MMRKMFLWVAGVFALLPVSPWVAAPAGALEWMHINVVDSTTVVPGGDGGTFDGLGRAGLDSGMVYFRGVGAGKFGFYAANYLGPTEVVALYDKTTPVPGGGGTTFFQFPGDPIMDHRAIVFEAKLSPGGAGIYTDAWGPLAVVADTDTAVPGGTGTFVGFGEPWICDQNVVFSGAQADGLAKGIYLHDGVTLRVVADLSTPIPHGTGNFTGFHTIKPFVEDGKVLFRAWGDGQEGIYLEESGSFTVIADLNTPVPGGTGNFTNLRHGTQLIDEDGWIIFSNQGFSDTDPTTPDADPGAYAYDHGVLSVLVDKNTAVLGTTDKLIHFVDGGIHSGREISIFGDFSPDTDRNVYSTLGGEGVQPVLSFGDLGMRNGSLGSYGWSVDGEAIATWVQAVDFNGVNFQGVFVSVPVGSAVPLMTTPWMHLGFAALLLIGGLKAIAARRPV